MAALAPERERLRIEIFRILLSSRSHLRANERVPRKIWVSPKGIFRADSDGTDEWAMADDDWNFMQRVASGDEIAVAELYDRFGPLVYKAARQSLPSRAEAEDAVQEVFVRLWRTADRFDPRRAKLVTWVMLITRRHLIDKLRRRGVRIDALSLDGDPAVAPSDGGRNGDPRGEGRLSEEQRQWMRDKLRELPELQRSVIERTYLQGFTLREVSEQLNSPLGTVKSALSRGLLRLRDRASGDRAHG